MKASLRCVCREVQIEKTEEQLVWLLEELLLLLKSTDDLSDTYEPVD